MSAIIIPFQVPLPRALPTIEGNVRLDFPVRPVTQKRKSRTTPVTGKPCATMQAGRIWEVNPM
jgi:hypothetical protein